ncbi:hypothetical protein FOA52_006754 [Chlamydomonas sp. UWO 241]|nr:hypothetical protein FOA52_006754 [Chlamydomonas sp. UWO 241]
MLRLDGVSALELLACLPCLLLIALASLPMQRQWVRDVLRPRMRAIVRAQLPAVLWVQDKLRSRAMRILTHATDFTVSLYFYVSVLAVSYILGFRSEATRLCSGVALATYLTSALKDLLCSPRPYHVASPDQRRRLHSTCDSKDGDVEYGAPSLHTAAGLCTALILVHVLVAHGVVPDTPAAQALGYAAACCWGCWIALTRVYMGVHSPLDLMLGAAVGCAVFSMWAAVGDDHQEWMVNLLAGSGIPLPQEPGASSPNIDTGHRVLASEHAADFGSDGEAAAAATVAAAAGGVARLVSGAAAAAAHCAALAWYPTPLHRTDSFGFATTFLGAWGGFPLVYGSGLVQATVATRSVLLRTLVRALPPALVRAALEVVPRAAWQAARLAVGVVFVIAVQPLSKALLTPLVRGVLDLLPPQLRARLAPPLSHVPIAELEEEEARLDAGATGARAPQTRARSSAGAGAQAPKGASPAGGGRAGPQAPAGSAGQSPRPKGGAGPSPLKGRGGGGSGGQPAGPGRGVGGKGKGADKAAAEGQPATNGAAGTAGGREGRQPAGESEAEAVRVTEAAGRKGRPAGKVVPGKALPRAAGGEAGPALAAPRARPDGYPFDADTVRRYLVYASMGAAAVLFHHASEVSVDEVAALLGGV